MAKEETENDSKLKIGNARGIDPESSALSNRNNKMCDSCITIISVVVFIAIIAALALALGLYFGYFDQEDIDNLSNATGIDLPSIPPFFFNDPFEGVPPESTAKWNNGNGGEGGLALTIKDYTSSDWESEFAQAILDWDNEGGTPDSLTLTTENFDYDSTCEFQDGVMIVCNEDYGETGWKGLNEYMVDASNIIVNSRAKMNEYYLNGATAEERLYVMCHEIGKLYVDLVLVVAFLLAVYRRVSHSYNIISLAILKLSLLL